MKENKSLNSPCLNCSGRVIMCHDTCEKYKQFKINRQEIETARQKFKTESSISVESVKRCKSR